MTVTELLAERARKAAASAATPGKPPARSLILRAGEEPKEPEAPQKAEAPGPRSLGGPKGERFPTLPANLTAEEAAWHRAAQGLDSELCAVRHPQDPETAWLALRHPTNKTLPPLLLVPLPWALYEHPDAPLPENEPY